jgi:hypothetical protein
MAADDELDTVYLKAAAKLCGCCYCSGDETADSECCVQTLLDAMAWTSAHVQEELAKDIAKFDKPGLAGRNLIGGLQRAISVIKKLGI